MCKEGTYHKLLWAATRQLPRFGTQQATTTPIDNAGTMASSGFNNTSSSPKDLDLDDKDQTQSQPHGSTETHNHHHYGHDNADSHLHERGLADTATLVLGPNITSATAVENGTTTASDEHLFSEKPHHHHNDAGDGHEVTREQTVVESNGNNEIEKTDTVTTVDDESKYPSGLKLGSTFAFIVTIAPSQ